jgi:hypothetical protein
VGAVFAARLAELLADRLPSEASTAPGVNSLTPELVAGLPEAFRLPIIASYNDALMPIFLVVVPLALAAAAVLLFLVEAPLATTIQREGTGSTSESAGQKTESTEETGPMLLP